MYKAFYFISLILLLFSCVDQGQESFETQCKTTIGYKIDSIHQGLSDLEHLKDKNKLVVRFKQLRKKYKTIEPFVEYYYQGFSRRINGPALPEIKTDDNMVNEATGWQVIEEMIFGDKALNSDQLKTQVNILKTDLKFVQNSLKDMPMQKHHFYELTQHQIIRLAVLGITGFDSPIAFNSLNETHAAIQGLYEFYAFYCDANHQEQNKKLGQLIKNSCLYIKQNNNFDQFNRLVFIKQYLMPLSLAFENEFKNISDKTPGFKDNKVFYGHLSDLMQGKKLNPDALSPYAESKSTPQKIALGKELFNENSLSKNNNMSCATCHKAEYAFSDGKTTSVRNIHHNKAVRNSPSLLYSALQKSFFYDMRSQDLENQIESVMKNADEFNLPPLKVKAKIKAKPKLAAAFAQAFPHKTEFDAYDIRNAIAAYVRSLMPFNAKIDKYFAGKIHLDQEESNGFNLFSGKAKCATCHFIPVYNGTAPPWFNNSESEVIGVPQKIVWQNAVVDRDQGRYYLNQIKQLQYAFKTPTLRNISKTAPYMHNGVYKNLPDVIRFYQLGGGNGIGMKLEHQSLPFDQLDLSEKEKEEIIAFLSTLTDEKKSQ